jgi:hypothetical protein
MRQLLLSIIAGFVIAMVMLFLTVSPLARRLRERAHIWRLRRLAGRLEAVMVAGTAVVIKDRPGGFHFVGTFSLDPGNIAAGGREVETVAIPGINIGDICFVCPQYATSLIVGYVTCRVAGTLEFSLENNTAGALDEGNNTWGFGIIRGTTGPLRVNT